jgi:isocitrate dehydrogenase
LTDTPTITIAYGDGIGPEIMRAALRVLRAAGAEFDTEEVDIGEKVYQTGNTSGITQEAWDSIHRNKILYKAPFTTPQGGGYKSINVTLRKSLGLFANVRPVAAYTPYIKSNFPELDLTIIRENEEDLYGGIEHRQTYEVFQTLKLLTLPGSERIIRYAFDYAVSNGRKRVTCMTKDNIMKLTDGMFHRMFETIAAEYPEIDSDHQIIDIGTARMAAQPEQFEVVVVPNLYGDILSDVAALLTGSVGLAGSANIGGQYAMFEAVHGSAPDIAGESVANPSGLILAGLLMLRFIGQQKVAATVQNAWLRTLEEGLHTVDIFREPHSTKQVGTEEFAEAIIERLGQTPERLPAANPNPEPLPRASAVHKESDPTKEIVGVDVFLDWDDGDRRDPNALGVALAECNGDGLELIMITNRGQKVWPGEVPATFRTDHWRCRFEMPDGQTTTHRAVADLISRVVEHGFDLIKTEGLFTFDGQPGFSLGQGQ